MKNCNLLNAILFLIIGGAIGAGITYHQFQCKTSGVNIKLDSNDKTGAGISITKTGNAN